MKTRAVFYTSRGAGHRGRLISGRFFRGFLGLSLSAIFAVLATTSAFATDPDPELIAAKKTVASKAYVDTKQDKITTGRVLFDESDGVYTYVPALVSYGTGTNGTDGILGNKIGVLDWNAYNAIFTDLSELDDDVAFDAGKLDDYVPTVRFLVKEFHRLAWDASSSEKSAKAINAYNTTFGNGTNNWGGNSGDLVKGQFLANSLALKQNKIAKSGYYYNTSGTVTAYGQNSSTNGWLHAGVKGTGLVTKTASDGVVGERKIFEATDVANYHATGLTQIQQDIQDISIPTVGAMMTAITNSITAAAPSGTPNTLANYDSTGALGSGIAVASAASYDSTTGALENGSDIPNITALETKQNKITTNKVLFKDVPDTQNDVYVPALAVTNAAGTELNANTVGILDYGTIYADEGDLGLYSDTEDYSARMDNFVPTVRAVANALQSIWNNLDWAALTWDSTLSSAIDAYSTTFDSTSTHVNGNWPRHTQSYLVNGNTFANALALKQNKLDAIASNARAQAVTRSTAGNTSSAYITEGGSVGLTTRSGAPAVINYVNGTVATDEEFTTFTNGTFGTATGDTLTNNKNAIKNALVSLELLKDVYGALHTEITNAAPTGTANTVANYDNTGHLGSGIATANAPTHNQTTGNLENGTSIATIAAVDTRQKKMTCAGYEPGHENEADYCWLWTISDD